MAPVHVRNYDIRDYVLYETYHEFTFYINGICCTRVITPVVNKFTNFKRACKNRGNIVKKWWRGVNLKKARDEQTEGLISQ